MDTSKKSRSLDHVNWWDPAHWKGKGPRTVSAVSLEGADPAEIRNGWLTLPDTGDKARFQQKQLQEREMKIASLYEAQQARALDRVRHSPSNGVNSTPPQQHTPVQTVPHQPGKVRQMFEERRTKAGIDKSYPLQPIHNTERTNRKALPNGYAKVSNTTSNTRVSVEKRSSKTHTSVSSHSVRKQNKIENLVNGSGDLNHNHEIDIKIKRSVPHTNGEIVTNGDEPDKIENNNDLLENETFPETLAPTPTPRSPEPVTTPEAKKTTTKTPSAKISPVKSKPQIIISSSSPRRVANDRNVPDTNKTRGAMQRPANTTPRKAPVTPRKQHVKIASASASTPKGRSTTATTPSSTAASGDACGVCGRHFAPDRIAKHQEICKKAHSKKRKPFDVLKHRLAGTEAEPFINKLRKTTTAPSNTKVNKSGKQLNSNWRQKHEEFIQAIRAAKQVQAHLNAGGKLSDLPPPPPSENPDYVQCPHCKRRFNQGAAERHIPKCANFQFNKPKPAAKKR